MTEKPSIVDALSAVMQDVQAVRKDDRNTDQNYKFRGIDAVMNAVGPALRRHGVVVMPMLEEARYRDVTTSRGKPSRECTVSVRYRFYGPAGDYLECVTPGESMDFGDKGAPKAMSVAYRIALLQALCLPTDEPEPDSQTYERAPEPPPVDPAIAARSRLKADADEQGWDLRKIAARYKADHGHALGEATDAAAIDRFRLSLTALPTAELAPNAPKENAA